MRVEGWKVPTRRWYRFLPALVLGYLVLMEAVLTEELDEEEQLVRRHRKEKKELQGEAEGSGNLEAAAAGGRARGRSVLGNLKA